MPLGYDVTTKSKMIMNELLAEVLQDPLLSDVRADTPLYELQLTVAKETGKNVVTLRLVLADDSTIDVEALPTWTVAQLKRSVERRIASAASDAAGRRRSISWKKHWRKYALMNEDVELSDGRQQLQQLLNPSLKGVHVLRFQRRARPPPAHNNRRKSQQ